MYYHEMEVCCSLGRETFLREPTYYRVFMGKFPDPLPIQYATGSDQNVFFARAMTELAFILKRTSEEIYHSQNRSQVEMAQTALKLDEDLALWKSQLSLVFDLDNTSLTEPETVTKRKIVLKLRYYSARILIHRVFLVASAYQGSSSSFSSNIQLCLNASQETIQLLYDTFLNRPFFRTWWYNTTYAFNSITIILYVLVSHLQKDNSEELLKVVEKSLKIFQAMGGITIARRCMELTQEIFDIAKTSLQQQGKKGPATQSNLGYDITSTAEAAPFLGGGIDIDESNFQTEFFASLIDPTILDTFSANLVNMDLASFENIDFL
jgi:hypothetical protein